MKPSNTAQERKVSLPALRMRADFKAETINDAERTVEVIWTTGAKVRRYPFFDEPYDEILSLDPAHIRMNFINSGSAPLLNSHEQRSLEDVIGVVEKAWLTAEDGRAIVRFSSRESVEPIWKDVRDGILKGISVGYRVYKFERQPASEGDATAAYLAVDWEPKEISLVAIGADDKAVVRGDAPGATECVFVDTLAHANTRGEEGTEIMDKIQEQPEQVQEKPTAVEAAATEKEPVAEAPAASAAEPVAEAEAPKAAETVEAPKAEELRQDAIASERKRVLEIRKAVKDAKLGEGLADQLIAGGASVDEARKQILKEWAKMDQTEIRSQGSVQIGRDETETKRAAVEGALLYRMGVEKAPNEPAREFVGLSLVEIGRKLTGMSQGTRSEVATRTMSSSDFPLILGNVAEKVLMNAYKKLPKTFDQIVSKGTLVDYKVAKRYQVGDAPSLAEVTDGAEYTYGSFGEAAESVQLKDYGKLIKFTRQMLINDDLHAFQSVINNFGAAAARLESSLVYGVLIDNAAMADGVALFHADHGNLHSASAITVATLGTMEKKMLDQTTLDGDDYLGITPKFLICGTAKKLEAQQMLASVLANASGSVNPFAGNLGLIVDPRISGNKWFLAASPDDIATIEVAYLEGESGPVMEQKEGWNSDGLEVKCRHTVAVKALEHRGLVYNPGA